MHELGRGTSSTPSVDERAAGQASAAYRIDANGTKVNLDYSSGAVGDFQTRPVEERVRRWSDELFAELLPRQGKSDVPVLLACDDETIRAAAERLGCDATDPSVAFASDIGVAYAVGKYGGWKRVTGGGWERASPPRSLPRFFPVLCLWVLAATRMAPDEKHATQEYHGRLCALLGIDAEDALPCFEFIGPRFADLAQWLEGDLAGLHGRLIVPDNPSPRHVGYAVAQTVFRLRDRQVLSTFFASRLQGSLEGFDPLRRLQRWSGRRQLTRHALRLVEEEEFADRVRAAISSAFRSWDGSELVETERGVGRLWPAQIRLVVYPRPHLQIGARNPKPLDLTVGADHLTLEPGRELDLPWSLLDQLEGRPVDLGDPRSTIGGLRLPRLGETVFFEDGDEGLLRTEQPAAESVWVLTRDARLQEHLQRWRLSDGGALPVEWVLFFDVPIAELPDVERSAVTLPRQTPLQIEGGLTLGHRCYLSGYPPHLVAGDLETDDALPVAVNGNLLGDISSSGRFALPGDTGRFDVDVGDGYFRVSYDIEERGQPGGLTLSHQLGSERALRSGARPIPAAGTDGATVCGARVSLRYQGVIPMLTRVAYDIETIDGDGELQLHRRPPTPPWFIEVGLDERGRWELFCKDPVWLVMPGAGGAPRVRLVVDRHLARLSVLAAKRVVGLDEEVAILRGCVSADEARRRWSALVRIAQQEVAAGGQETVR